MEKFIELGGGAENGKFVIVPTNGGNRERDGQLDQVRRSDRDRALAASADSRT